MDRSTVITDLAVAIAGCLPDGRWTMASGEPGLGSDLPEQAPNCACNRERFERTRVALERFADLLASAPKIPGKVEQAPCGCDCVDCRMGNHVTCRDPFLCAERTLASHNRPTDREAPR